MRSLINTLTVTTSYRVRALAVLLLLLTPFYLHYLYHYLAGSLDLRTTRHLVYSNILIIYLYLPVILLRGKQGLALAFILQSVLSISEFFYLTLYNAPLGKSTFYILFETNLAEAAGYMSIYMKLPSLALYVVFLVIVLMIMMKISRGPDIKEIRAVLFIFLVLATLPLLSRPNRATLFSSNTLLKLHNSYKEYKADHARQRMIASKRLDEIEAVSPDTAYSDEEIHVLVIGESTGRHHMGLYGYSRDTTPELKKIENELYIFNDVVSPSSHTIPALKTALTFANYENRNDFHDKGSLIQYMKKAGYKTFWVSNQIPVGIFENLITVLAKASDVALFVNNNEYHKDYSLDERVLEPLKRIVRDGAEKKFIIIHLMGNHHPYCRRYSGAFSRFAGPVPGRTLGASEIINCYDNAVLYNDFILSEIIRLVKKQDAYSSVLYFSDHGEDVYDTSGDVLGHTESQGTRYMFDIPFILWLSEKYKRANSDETSYYTSFLGRKYLNDDVIHTVFDLLNFRADSYESRRSILSRDFEYKSRLIDMRDYDMEIAGTVSIYDFKKNMLTRQSKSFQNKVWAHKVNTLNKLREAAGIFKGLELDVVFDSTLAEYDVRHPPEPSTGLNLERYFASLDNPGQYRFWLDFKNIDRDNAALALQRLNVLTGTYNIPPKNIIVESTKPLLLPAFRDAGYYTSYYLPSGLLRNAAEKNRTSLTGKEIKKIDRIADIVRKGTVDAVSTHNDYYSFVKEYLPEAQAVLLWDYHLEHHRAEDFLQIKHILAQDKRIKVLLVSYAESDEK